MTEPDKRRAMLIGRLMELEPEVRRTPDAVRVARAPGRVNLIGEHTDYNQGFGLPVAIDLETWIAAVPTTDGVVRLTSLSMNETASFTLAHPGPPRGEWIDYVAGVALELAASGVTLHGLRGVIDSDIPAGAGLSSSAALELAAAWALTSVVPPPIEAMDLARAAQRAENSYVGVMSGLMDQFAAVFGRAREALLLDCRSLAWRPVALPVSHVLVALDTRSPHRLEASEYNARRAQCEAGVAALAQLYPEVTSLRDATEPMIGRLSPLVDEETVRRCLHVVRENERVMLTVGALEQADLAAIGRLFADSHASLRELYEVSSPDLDALVEIASAVPGVVGARMTGAGFGGCTVNLVQAAAVERLRDVIEEQYPARAGRRAGFYLVQPVDGAGLVENASSR